MLAPHRRSLPLALQGIHGRRLRRPRAAPPEDIAPAHATRASSPPPGPDRDPDHLPAAAPPSPAPPLGRVLLAGAALGAEAVALQAMASPGIPSVSSLGPALLPTVRHLAPPLLLTVPLLPVAVEAAGLRSGAVGAGDALAVGTARAGDVALALAPIVGLLLVAGRLELGTAVLALALPLAVVVGLAATVRQLCVHEQQLVDPTLPPPRSARRLARSWAATTAAVLLASLLSALHITG